MPRPAYRRSRAEKILTLLKESENQTLPRHAIIEALKSDGAASSTRSILLTRWLERGWISEARTLTLTEAGKKALYATRPEEELPD